MILPRRLPAAQETAFPSARSERKDAKFHKKRPIHPDMARPGMRITRFSRLRGIILRSDGPRRTPRRLLRKRNNVWAGALREHRSPVSTGLQAPLQQDDLSR